MSFSLDRYSVTCGVGPYGMSAGRWYLNAWGQVWGVTFGRGPYRVRMDRCPLVTVWKTARPTGRIVEVWNW